MGGQPLAKWRRFKRQAVTCAVMVLSLTLCLAFGHASYRYTTKNLTEVVPGELYRSAQIDRDDLAAFKERYGIRSVLNLRGAQASKGWYQEEIAAAAELGLQHASFKMRANKPLSDDEAEWLIALMARMPKPLLVHCRQGADRTGLASALYLAAVKGMDPEAAEGQLSIYFGHVALPYLSEGWSMTETWERLELAMAAEAE